jgi:lipopolysaccharide transport system ATP-binding protein
VKSENEAVLVVQNVGKRYASYSSLFSRSLSWLGLAVSPRSTFWALRDVSFNVAAGEALAVIGSNGSGKSTLLKTITGTIRPTVGSVHTRGRISAILELGLGFNPELTGRQNVFLAGGLMGHSASHLADALPRVEEFAELGDFFDRALREYSSGMQARLAFATATAFRPEVLIVDEVLSVGDAYFQHKSFDRIRAFKSQGTTVLFVTHSMADVRALCERVILLESGRVLRDGPADEVVDYYNALVAARDSARLSVEQRREKHGWIVTRSGSGEAAISSTTLRSAQTGEETAVVRSGQPLVLEVVVRVNADIHQLVLGAMIRNREGQVVWGSNTWHTGQTLKQVAGGSQISFNLHFDALLGPGSYSITCALHAGGTHIESNYEWTDNALVFEVINIDSPTFVGTANLPARFEIRT